MTSTTSGDGFVTGTEGNNTMLPGYVDVNGDRIDGNDAILPGTFGDDDVIVAGGGNDLVDAGLGNDLIYGGAGADTLLGGMGNDTILGDDTLAGVALPGGSGGSGGTGGTGGSGGTGGTGGSCGSGGTGGGVVYDDLIYGGAGNDVVLAGQGSDTVYGGTGNDTVTGGAGADTLFGGADADLFIGATTGDRVDGNEEGCDQDTLDLTGAGPLHITYDPNNPENGTVDFLDPVDRHVVGSMTFKNIENVIPCFTPGTLIATPRGEVAVENLRVGDKVITRDNGMQEIRWLGRRDLTWADLARAPHLKPILIRTGSLGQGLPERDMIVSPNHRLLVANDRTALYFDEHEVLVAAKHLVSGANIRQIDAAGTSYIHFLCDRHEVVLSNGAWSESFQPGDMTLKGMGNSQRSEIYELFPELETAAGLEAYGAARKTLKRHEARLIAG